MLPKATDILYLSVKNRMQSPNMTDVKKSNNPNLKRAKI